MLDEELATVIEDIAETLFAVPIQRVQLSEGEFAQGVLRAHVDFRGGFTGVLSATMSEKLARQLATLMMHKLRGRCSADEAHDAVGEIANIAAGNLRGLLAEDCQISLPTTGGGEPFDTVLSCAQFRLFGQPFSVELRGVPKARAESSTVVIS